jgi:hypothetical protein
MFWATWFLLCWPPIGCACPARCSPCVSRRIHLYPVEARSLAPQSHSRPPNTPARGWDQTTTRCSGHPVGTRSPPTTSGRPSAAEARRPHRALSTAPSGTTPFST